MSRLTDEDKKAIKKAYRALDENGDGRVSIREVKRASKRLGIEFSDAQLKKAMGELDENDDGYLSYKEYEAMVVEQIETEEVQKLAAHKMFLAMDRDGDGKVTVAEISAALKCSKQEAQDLLNDADTNKDGKMSFEEFFNAYTGTNQQQQ